MCFYYTVLVYKVDYVRNLHSCVMARSSIKIRDRVYVFVLYTQAHIEDVLVYLPAVLLISTVTRVLQILSQLRVIYYEFIYCLAQRGAGKCGFPYRPGVQNRRGKDITLGPCNTLESLPLSHSPSSSSSRLLFPLFSPHFPP